ncbi:MAG TPA: MarR family transcriptional regulator [Spirochaetales bacterium]|nr:MarR family transcriptional regulator [Spirochaetales bacterium]
MRDEGPLAILESMERVSAAWRRKATEALKPFGITLAQYELIRHARVFGAMAPSAMADALDWDRPTLTVVARPCLATGWLRKRHSARDRRSFRLELAGPGEELLDRIEAARPFAPERIGDPFDVIGADERAQIGRLLDRAARRARDVWARGARA